VLFRKISPSIHLKRCSFTKFALWL
jgi:hypothetical protein